MTNPVVDLVGDKTGQHRARLPAVREGGGDVEGHRPAHERGARPRPARFADPVPAEVLQRLRAHRPHRGLPRHPRARVDGGGAERPPAAGLRRAAAGAAARWCSASACSRRTAKGIRHDVDGRAGAPLPRRPALPADRRPGAAPSPRSTRTSPARTRCTGCCRATSGRARRVVAVSALLVAVQGGHQGALMAPTEVLAEQHALGVRAQLAGLTVPSDGGDDLFASAGGPRAARRAAHQPHDGRRAPAHPRRPGRRASVDLVIGTHALIQEGIEFRVARRRRHRRAAPLRRRAAGRARGPRTPATRCPTCSS